MSHVPGRTLNSSTIIQVIKLCDAMQMKLSNAQSVYRTYYQLIESMESERPRNLNANLPDSWRSRILLLNTVISNIVSLQEKLRAGTQTSYDDTKRDIFAAMAYCSECDRELLRIGKETNRVKYITYGDCNLHLDEIREFIDEVLCGADFDYDAFNINCIW